MAKKHDCPFVDNEMPYGRVPQGHPVIVDYFYHEEIRGTEKYRKKKSLNSSYRDDTTIIFAWKKESDEKEKNYLPQPQNFLNISTKPLR